MTRRESLKFLLAAGIWTALRAARMAGSQRL